jgi:hypothetical protein
MNTVLYAPIFSRSGYGDHSREILEYLTLNESIKSNLKVVPTSWGKNPNTDDNSDFIEKIRSKIYSVNEIQDKIDLYIQIGMPNEFKPLGFYNIGITAGAECNRVSQSYIENSNLMDCLIVPSEFTKQTFIDSVYLSNKNESIKITNAIHVISEFADTKFYYKNNTNNNTLKYISGIKEDFCFLFNGQWNSSSENDGGRKNIKSLIDTFVKTFSNEVSQPALILKTQTTSFCKKEEYILTEYINDILRNIKTKSKPSVYLLFGNLNTKELSDLYNHEKVKCFVTHSRGEGFGRPILESCLASLPVIAPKFGGYLDFLNCDTLVNGELVDVNKTNTIFCENSKWFEINEAESSNKMKDVFLNYEKYKKEFIKISDDVYSKTSKQIIFKKLDSIINNIRFQ